jgi:hypothetical protein
MKGSFMKTKMNLRRIVFCAAAIVLFLMICPASAVIFSGTKFNLDFTKPEELAKKAIWGSVSKDVKLSQHGLIFQVDKPQGALTDIWVEVTEPIAVGFSWRTVSSVHIEAEVIPSGQSGSLYSRYSADALHWSNWQNIQMNSPKDPNQPQQKYSGVLSVPVRQQQSYTELLMKYQKMDVPWKIDEEAAVEWIVKNDPKFFESPAPFIGYVQFLLEISLKGGQSIKTMTFDIKYGTGGLIRSSKDPNDFIERMKLDVPWRYKAQSKPETGTMQFRANAIESAIDAYYLNCGVYPKTLDDLLVCPPGLPGKWAGPYIKESGLYDSNGKKYIYTPDGKVIESSETK